MKEENIELRSEKVRNVIGKVPRKLVVVTIAIYLFVLLLIAGVVYLLNIETTGIINRLLGI